ncbi:hypothetical protein [Parvibaculum sp.]|uniref:hypothetical protein n=1 Tax=Parvibaculum sp. TaxID=2024848 RepID=UPI0034A07DBA
MHQKLIIHVGPHKTGTTSLQHFLFKNHLALLKLGIVYPVAHLGEQRAHHRFAQANRGRIDQKERRVLSREEELVPLLDEIRASNADTAILSSEAFFATSKPDIEILHESLRAFSPVVVFYARQQDDGYVSSYAQCSKSPIHRYASPIETHLDDPVRMNTDLNIYGHASNWAKVFGKENVAARLYDRKISVPEDFLRFLDERRGAGPVLASAMKRFSLTEALNNSPSLEATEITRLFKSQCLDPERRRAVFNLMNRHFSDGRPVARLLSTSDRRAILEFFRSSNEKLFREFFSSENRFAPELLLQGPETAREALTIEDMTKAIAYLVDLQSVVNPGPLRRVVNLAARFLRPA